MSRALNISGTIRTSYATATVEVARQLPHLA